MAVRYVVEDNSWGGEVNVPRKEFLMSQAVKYEVLYAVN